MGDFAVVSDPSPYLLPIVEQSLHVEAAWVLQGIVSFACMGSVVANAYVLLLLLLIALRP